MSEDGSIIRRCTEKEVEDKSSVKKREAEGREENKEQRG